ncbi:hypothetical protein C731_3401 [Mycolicibacterium hassiacum DSM 44199]|uniref:Uncharacterized protein n=1 Tax=Mycolicibacterium hassiacum (strain DSM 44199 / CIP 105218 / JCM 12690 / 3849) TaxID=1122247 RepID=K5BEW7_MYCHD|nr:hypothetical protein C731_3401 [Mycolicibacterium hassiacum DSM 44199]MDA4088834.1 hypothetical protein [Mycolicibacterium hassiacum DSM 44199]
MSSRLRTALRAAALRAVTVSPDGSTVYVTNFFNDRRSR